MTRDQIEIIVPLYNEEHLLDELIKRLKSSLDSIPNLVWRVIFVDDGSYDQTRRMILDYRDVDSRFALVALNRNFGHQSAITAGIEHATADAVVIIDGDLQDPPEVIPQLVQHWREGAHVVVATRKSREETGLRRLGINTFHRWFRWISDFPIPSQTGSFCLLDSKAVREFRMLPERNRFIPGLRAWLGGTQATVEYDRKERYSGEPKQTLRRLFRYGLDGIFSFSFKPLRIMTWAGLLLSATSFFIVSYFIIKRLLGLEEAVTGFTTLVTMIVFLGGMQLIAVGILGEYLGRVYDEVKRRPLYLVRETAGLEDRPSVIKDLKDSQS